MSEKASKQKSKLQIILFALMLSIICSMLITLTAVGLKDRQMANMALDKKLYILKAAGLAGPKKPSKKNINALFEKHIKSIIVDSSGQVIKERLQSSLHLYLIKKDNAYHGYILPITTKGLWGKIQGYLAFEKDGQTVSGFSVFSHSETPGLGGEIESAWFGNNFKGKKILNRHNEFVSVGIAKGRVSDLPVDEQHHYVDGISGATLTGKYLSQGIRDTLVRYNPVSIMFRQNKAVGQELQDEKRTLK